MLSLVLVVEYLGSERHDQYLGTLPGSPKLL